MLEPTICTSIDCRPPQDYCIKCSHAIWKAEVIAKNGLRYAFEFSPRFGPSLIDLHGEMLDIQPDECSPFWDAFQVWHDEKFKGETE